MRNGDVAPDAFAISARSADTVDDESNVTRSIDVGVRTRRTKGAMVAGSAGRGSHRSHPKFLTVR